MTKREALAVLLDVARGVCAGKEWRVNLQAAIDQYDAAPDDEEAGSGESETEAPAPYIKLTTSLGFDLPDDAELDTLADGIIDHVRMAHEKAEMIRLRIRALAASVKERK